MPPVVFKYMYSSLYSWSWSLSRKRAL